MQISSNVESDWIHENYFLKNKKTFFKFYTNIDFTYTTDLKLEMETELNRVKRLWTSFRIFIHERGFNFGQNWKKIIVEFLTLH